MTNPKETCYLTDRVPDAGASVSYFSDYRLHEDNCALKSRFKKPYVYNYYSFISGYRNHMDRNIHQKKLLLII